MRTSAVLVLTSLVITCMISSCNMDSEEGDNGSGNVLPDLTFAYSVNGAIDQNGSWQSPENDQNLGGHDNSVLSNHSSTNNKFMIVGIGADYTFSLESDMNAPTVGSHTIQDAVFSGLQSSFGNVVSGTLQLDEVPVNFETPGTTHYRATGSFAIELENGATPPETITFSGTFEGLNVTATN